MFPPLDHIPTPSTVPMLALNRQPPLKKVCTCNCGATRVPGLVWQPLLYQRLLFWALTAAWVANRVVLTPSCKTAPGATVNTQCVMPTGTTQWTLHKFSSSITLLLFFLLIKLCAHLMSLHLLSQIMPEPHTASHWIGINPTKNSADNRKCSHLRRHRRARSQTESEDCLHHHILIFYLSALFLLPE